MPLIGPWSVPSAECLVFSVLGSHTVSFSFPAGSPPSPPPSPSPSRLVLSVSVAWLFEGNWRLLILPRHLSPVTCRKVRKVECRRPASVAIWWPFVGATGSVSRRQFEGARVSWPSIFVYIFVVCVVCACGCVCFWPAVDMHAAPVLSFFFFFFFSYFRISYFLFPYLCISHLALSPCACVCSLYSQWQKNKLKRKKNRKEKKRNWKSITNNYWQQLEHCRLSLPRLSLFLPLFLSLFLPLSLSVFTNGTYLGCFLFI